MTSNLLYDTLLTPGRQDPARRFAVLPDGTEWTYGDVETATARMANVLTDLGVTPGDRVAVQVGKSLDALMLYLATVRAGGVYLPLNPAYTASEVDYFLGDAAPRVFVCDPDDRATLASVAEVAGAALETLGAAGSADRAQGSRGSLRERADDASGQFDTVPREADDLAANLYTSGTTGRSKGAMLTHANLLSNAQVLREAWCFTDQDVLLHVLPIFHTHGLFVAVNTTLLAGGALIFLPRFDVDEVLRTLPDATAMMGVPTYYTRLLAEERLTREVAGHLRLFTSGSAPLLADTHRQFEARTGERILERYGMTETSMLTSNPYDGERRPGTVGFPLSGVDLRVVAADTGEPLPQEEIGVIEVAGPNVFAGYWRMPDKTAQEFRDDGFFVTGDLGTIDADGYVSIVGRGKDLVISGGLNVYPKEVELALDELAGVVESAVIGVPHPDLGEGVVAVVVGERELDEAELAAALADRLARFKQPKRIVFVDELPRNTMGKVQKGVLREQFADLLAGA